jgi:hypothetical protein
MESKKPTLTGSKGTADLVDLVARTVLYDLQGDRLYALALDFEVCELGQKRQTATPDATRISVEFDAEVSKDVVIRALQYIVDEIKRTGLPKVRKKMERRGAALVMKVQDEAAKLSEELKKLPVGLRAEAQRMVKSLLLSAHDGRVNKRTFAKP